jgi:glycosyltransferase involved in cell wall biosynthesis
MRVVHVGLETSATRPGGLNRYLEDLVHAERVLGLDAVAVVLGDEGTDPQRDHGTVVAGPAVGSLVARARRIDRAVRALGEVDVADVHFAGSGFVTACVGALRRVPTVVHFQGPWADESAASGSSSANVATKRAIERAVYRRARRFVVLSASFASLLESRYGVAPWAIEVVAPGVDLERFSPGDAAAERTALGAGGGRIVLAVRRLVPRMGLEVLLDAWRELAPASGDRLVVIGEGPSRGSLSELAQRLGVADTVSFLGRVDDATLVQWYRAADLTVVPSVALEGFGLVVLESVACGTPVVGTDADGLREALALVGQAAVSAGDAAALASAMRAELEVRADPARRAELRAVGERHGWADVALRHRAIYDEVLDLARPPSVVVLDHTAVLSGGELAIARAIDGLGGAASIHTILAADGPLRARLEAAGSTVEVLALDERARSVPRGSVRPGRLDPLAALASARYVLRLARRLRVLRPDVVHTNSLKSALYGGVAARLAGVPCVWHVRDRIEVPYLPAPAVRLVRVAARVLPTVVVANSASTLATVGVTRGVVVPSPLDSSIDASVAHVAHEGHVRVVMLGRLAQWKGQRLALEAFATAFPEGGATLEVVGSALFGEEAYADSLPALAASLGLEGRVSFRGFVDDVATVLGEADVVVHASILPEPFGQVVLEAMGAGCAVVVADAGGPKELVTDGVDGLVYPMGDRAALAGAMQQLAADPALRQRLGAAAQHTASSFTPAALAPRLLDAWSDARSRPRRARRHAHG